MEKNPPTKEETEAMQKAIVEMSDRILGKIKEQMIILSKDEKLKKEMFEDIAKEMQKKK